jgi:hypothetical protein
MKTLLELLFGTILLVSLGYTFRSSNYDYKVHERNQVAILSDMILGIDIFT